MIPFVGSTCMLVNVFDQGGLDDPATLEALTPSHDAESGQRQAYGQVVDDVRRFHVPKHISCLRRCTSQA